MKFDDISNNVLYNNINTPIKTDLITLFFIFTFICVFIKINRSKYKYSK